MYILVTYIMKYHGKNEEQVFSLVLSKKYSRIRAFNEDTLKSRSKLLKEGFIKGWSEKMHVRTRTGQSSPTWRSGYIHVKDCTSLISPNSEANFQSY